MTPVKGSAQTPKAFPEVVIFIWSFSALVLFMVAMIEGGVAFFWCLLLVPFAAMIQIGLSKMAGTRVWAWSMAGLYVGYFTFWFFLIQSV